MSKQTEALKLALEALQLFVFQPSEEALDYADNAIDAIRKALAEQPAQQEPVAVGSARCPRCWEPITPQPSKPWVGLTEVAIWNTYKNLWMFHPAEEPRLAGDILKFARAIEAKLREKNA